jgi:hypothetical protein
MTDAFDKVISTPEFVGNDRSMAEMQDKQISTNLLTARDEDLKIAEDLLSNGHGHLHLYQFWLAVNTKLINECLAPDHSKPPSTRTVKWLSAAVETIEQGDSEFFDRQRSDFKFLDNNAGRVLAVSGADKILKSLAEEKLELNHFADFMVGASSGAGLTGNIELNTNLLEIVGDTKEPTLGGMLKNDMIVGFGTALISTHQS